MINANDIVVIKRDSDKENFSYDKVITSILRCGVPMEAAEKFSKQIESWVSSIAKEGKVDSAELRDKIIKLISPEFPSEADSYQAYVKG